MDHEVLVSFDVVSLFPSIPENIQIIDNKWDIIQKHTTMTKKLFLEIVNFCIADSIYFLYSKNIYRQLKGMPMGYPASPVIADIVMENLLDECMDKLTIKPRFLTKYVDDLFGIIDKNYIDEALKTLNAYHKEIKFTVEMEHNNKLAYLDTMITKDKNTIKLDWYQKSISSGRLINFYSKHAKNIIINTASNFIRRVLQISDFSFHQNNIKKFKTIFNKNGFP